MHFHHLHFYVEDVAFWRCWFVSKLAFKVAGDRELLKGRSSFELSSMPVVLVHGAVEIRLSGRDSSAEALGQGDEVATYLGKHPDGLADVAFASDRFNAVVETAIAQGAQLTRAIHINEKGQRQCQFQGWANLRHTLIESAESATQPNDAFLQEIDHVVINVPKGELAAAADWYQRTFALSYGQRFEIKTAHSGLRSQVMMHSSGSLQLPFNEPSSQNSQVQEFLRHNKGAGVQHVALRSADAVRAIAHFKSQGLDLIDVPDAYYDRLPLRLDCPIKNAEALAAVSDQRLLVDWVAGGNQGMLLQTFTKPIFAAPTFFFEIIERGGYVENGKPEVAQGFGEGNFQALFEAIERSQLERGSLENSEL